MNKISMRDAFFDVIYDKAKKDRNIIVISADMGAPSLDKFRRDLAGQFINVGIAEENMVAVATGLALEGKKVFIYAIMPFVTSRCYEMIKVDLSLMNVPVTVVGVGAGFSYDDSGPTHHSTEDIAIMRTLPNMTILSPSDIFMTAKFADMSCSMRGPNYVRLDREVLPVIYRKSDKFTDGLANLKSGDDVCIVSTGNMVHAALTAAVNLKKRSISAAVIDLYRPKPINSKALLKSVSGSKRVVTLEEQLISGGLGSAVVEILSDSGNRIPVKRIAIPDKYYYAYGGRKNIQQLCNIDAESVTKQIADWVK